MLNDAAKLKITEIAKKRGLEFVVLFGSTARKTNRKDSDIDIAVLSKKPADISKSTTPQQRAARHVVVTRHLETKTERRDIPVCNFDFVF